MRIMDFRVGLNKKTVVRFTTVMPLGRRNAAEKAVPTGGGSHRVPIPAEQ